MSSLRAIKKRITSVKNTQQITKAMKMVSAAKLRRAQEAITSARPYALAMKDTVFDLASRVDRSSHPLFNARTVKKLGILVITSDRGLCGSFNGNVIRALRGFLHAECAEYDEVSLYTIGRKGNEVFKREGRHIKKEYLNVLGHVTFSLAEQISSELAEEYVKGEIDEIRVFYNEFKSAISQETVSETLLPLTVEEQADEFPVEFLYEPDKQSIIESLIPRFLATQIFRYLLESLAGEHGARMTAMDAATNNSAEMIDKLTLQMNRARQATITRELMEIIGGKEAIEQS